MVLKKSFSEHTFLGMCELISNNFKELRGHQKHQGKKLSFQFTCPFEQVQCAFYLSGPQNYLTVKKKQKTKTDNNNTGYMNNSFLFH